MNLFNNKISMEELGDIKNFRKNLMLISVLTILIFIFSENIKEINILWIIKLEDIESYKILGILLILNLYTLIRYLQYFIKYDLSNDKKILVIDIINHSYFKKNIIDSYQLIFNASFSHSKIKHHYKKDDILSINYNNGISLDTKDDSMYFFCHNALKNNNITWWIFGMFENRELKVYLHNKYGKELDDNIVINYNNNNYIMFLLLILYYIKEHNFSDYYLPIFLWIISSSIIFIQLIKL